MDWAKLIFFNAIRVTVGLTSGLFLVWLIRSFGRGGVSLPGFIDYVAALFRAYSIILVAVWIALVIFEVVRNRPRSRKKSDRPRPGVTE
jgi:hypothetical protein